MGTSKNPDLFVGLQILYPHLQVVNTCLKFLTDSILRFLKIHKLLLVGLLLVNYLPVYTQSLTSPNYIVETGSSVSMGRETPFWLISNQYGLLTPNKFNEWIKAGVHTQLSLKKDFDYDYCF